MDNTEKYKEYFESRNINLDFYSNYKLPGYLKNHLPTELNAPILDIGCGFGQTLSKIKEMGYTNLLGVDISESAINTCKETGLNVEKISGISEFSEKSDKKYEMIVMSHVLEHIEKVQIIDMLKIIKERLLTDSGKLFIIVPNAQSNTNCYWAYEDFTHTTLFTSGSLIYVLKAAGFNKIEFLDINGYDDSTFIIKLFKMLFIRIFRFKTKFWNLATSSMYHTQSPEIFTFDIKVKTGI